MVGEAIGVSVSVAVAEGVCVIMAVAVSVGVAVVLEVVPAGVGIVGLTDFNGTGTQADTSRMIINRIGSVFFMSAAK